MPLALATHVPKVTNIVVDHGNIWVTVMSPVFTEVASQPLLSRYLKSWAVFPLGKCADATHFFLLAIETKYSFQNAS